MLKILWISALFYKNIIEIGIKTTHVKMNYSWHFQGTNNLQLWWRHQIGNFSDLNFKMFKTQFECRNRIPLFKNILHHEKHANDEWKNPSLKFPSSSDVPNVRKNSVEYECGWTRISAEKCAFPSLMAFFTQSQLNCVHICAGDDNWINCLLN